ncbi:MAG: hypothetical protein JXA87_07790 [Thermoleophilia bacterium]|nr:hypothetical protein [Thermoleophilia bacterium]
MKRRALAFGLTALLMMIIIVLLAAPIALAEEAASIEGHAVGIVEILGTNVLFTQALFIILLVVLDVVVTVAWAIGTGKYEWAKLLEFLKTNVARYFIVWAALAGIGWVANRANIPDWTATGYGVLIDVVYALIVAKLLHSIATTFQDLGIPTDAIKSGGTNSKLRE